MVWGVPANRLASVSNAARLLRSFTASTPTWGVTELARAAGQSKSSVHRILSTLADEGLLERDPVSGRYRLGLAMVELAAAVPTHRDLHEVVLSPMTELRNWTGETVQVGVLDGRQVVYVERLDSPNTLRLFTELGRRIDAHCTSTGKALLAFSPLRTLEKALTGWQLTARTPHTIVTIPALRDELDEIRRLGYARNRHESEVGVVSVAAPIRNGSGAAMAAMSVAGPAERMDSMDAEVTAAVVEAAHTASRRLSELSGLSGPSEPSGPSGLGGRAPS